MLSLFFSNESSGKNSEIIPQLLWPHLSWFLNYPSMLLNAPVIKVAKYKSSNLTAKSILYVRYASISLSRNIII